MRSRGRNFERVEKSSYIHPYQGSRYGPMVQWHCDTYFSNMLKLSWRIPLNSPLTDIGPHCFVLVIRSFAPIRFPTLFNLTGQFQKLVMKIFYQMKKIIIIPVNLYFFLPLVNCAKRVRCSLYSHHADLLDSNRHVRSDGKPCLLWITKIFQGFNSIWMKVERTCVVLDFVMWDDAGWARLEMRNLKGRNDVVGSPRKENQIYSVPENQMAKRNGQVVKWIRALHYIINVCTKVPTLGGISGGVTIGVDNLKISKIWHHIVVQLALE